MRKYLQIFVLIFVALTFPVTASIIKRPPTKIADLNFQDLPYTAEQKAIIYEIISALGEKSKMSLLFKQGYYKDLGERIKDVHPLKFLSVIFSDPYLKSCMLVVWNDYFKRTNFLEDLIPALEREKEKGKLHCYIKDFSETLGINHEHLQGYFDSQDWENMVLFLIQS